MQKIKNHLLAVISCAFLIVITGLEVITEVISGSNLSKLTFIILISIGLVIASSLLKEKHLYKSAFLIYLCAVVLLILQLILDDNPALLFVEDRYINIGSRLIMSSVVLPFCCFQLSETITESKSISFNKLLLLCLLTLLPSALVMKQLFLTPICIVAIVCFIILVFLKKENRINIPGLLFSIAVILICGVSFAFYMYFYVKNSKEYFSTEWARNIFENLFRSSHFIGATEYKEPGQTFTQLLYNLYNYKVAIFLAKYGWLAFLAVISLFVGFFVSIFKMIAKIKQSPFAKYTALFCGLTLVAQPIYSIFGILFLNVEGLNFPFFGGLSIKLVDYILFGLILGLYLKRDKPSEIGKIKDGDFLLPHLKKKIYDIVGITSDIDDEDDIDDDLDSIIELKCEDGSYESFELLDIFEYSGGEYMVLLPVEDNNESDRVVILQVEETEDFDEESYISVDDENILNAVYDVFKERNKNIFNFLD